ncbi:MAG: Lrp/AsnC family transcriptional regulator [Candidatus Njordarchaeales archaeon]
MIDEKDWKIIKILLRNGRATYTEMAKELNLTEAAARKRVKRLENMGIIKGYRAIVDWRKLGYNTISLTGIDTEPEALFEVAKILKEKEWVISLSLTTGDHMLMAEIIARDNQELMKILEEIGKIPGVKKICPAIILDVLKD